MLKRVLLCLFVVLLLVSMTFASTPLGPPVAGLRQGQLRLGVDYGNMDGDIEIEDLEVEGVEANIVLANIGLGITKDFELYGLVGITDGDYDEAGEEFNSSFEDAYGFGTKMTFAQDECLSWGAVYQMVWLRPEDNVNIGATELEVEADIYDIKAAVGPCYNSNGIMIYGGPMLYYLEGEVDAELPGIASVDGDIDQDVQFGGYGGIGLNLSENVTLTGEYQYTHDVESWGASLSWKF